MGIYVSIAQREVERQKYERELERMKEGGVINVVDDYILSAIENPKEQRGFLAARYKKFERKQDKIRAEQNEQRQVEIKQQGDNMQNKEQAKSQGDVQKVFAQGQVSSKLLDQAAKIGMTERQLSAAIDNGLQSNRGRDQLNKAVKTLQEKSNLERQQPPQDARQPVTENKEP